MRSAYSKHGLRTGQVAQIDFARFSRASRSSLRSKCDGGKNNDVCGPRHAALSCHNSSA